MVQSQIQAELEKLREKKLTNKRRTKLEDVPGHLSTPEEVNHYLSTLRDQTRAHHSYAPSSLSPSSKVRPSTVAATTYPAEQFRQQVQSWNRKDREERQQAEECLHRFRCSAVAPLDSSNMTMLNGIPTALSAAVVEEEERRHEAEGETEISSETESKEVHEGSDQSPATTTTTTFATTTTPTNSTTTTDLVSNPLPVDQVVARQLDDAPHLHQSPPKETFSPDKAVSGEAAKEVTLESFIMASCHQHGVHTGEESTEAAVAGSVDETVPETVEEDTLESTPNEDMIQTDLKDASVKENALPEVASRDEQGVDTEEESTKVPEAGSVDEIMYKTVEEYALESTSKENVIQTDQKVGSAEENAVPEVASREDHDVHIEEDSHKAEEAGSAVEIIKEEIISKSVVLDMASPTDPSNEMVLDKKEATLSETVSLPTGSVASPVSKMESHSVEKDIDILGDEASLKGEASLEVEAINTLDKAIVMEEAVAPFDEIASQPEDVSPEKKKDSVISALEDVLSKMEAITNRSENGGSVRTPDADLYVSSTSVSSASSKEASSDDTGSVPAAVNRVAPRKIFPRQGYASSPDTVSALEEVVARMEKLAAVSVDSEPEPEVEPETNVDNEPEPVVSEDTFVSEGNEAENESELKARSCPSPAMPVTEQDPRLLEGCEAEEKKDDASTVVQNEDDNEPQFAHPEEHRKWKIQSFDETISTKGSQLESWHADPTWCCGAFVDDCVR